jgi:hypothetical protein
MINHKTELNNIPQEFICPISMEIMQDPVICNDGYTYERSSIMALENLISPITRQRINKNQIFPNRALKETKFLEGNKDEFKNPLVINNPTHKYENFSFEIKLNENEILIKIQNINTNIIYEGILNNKNIHIKPLTKFNIMLNRSLEKEENYNITFEEINDTHNKLIVKILFNNDILDIEQSFTLNELIMEEQEKHKYKIMFLENEIKYLKSIVSELKQNDDTFLLMSKVISVTDQVRGVKNNHVIEYKFPKNLEDFDLCKFIQDTDIKRDNFTESYSPNKGTLLKLNDLSNFTNLKKINIPNINYINNKFLPKLEIITITNYNELNNNQCCFSSNSIHVTITCPNLKKIVIENLYYFQNITNNVPEYNFTIEAKLFKPNIILNNGYRMCEYHNISCINTQTCPTCDFCKNNAPIKLKQYCESKNIKYKLIE